MSDEAKRAAAAAAADRIEDGQLLGLGTGSTAALFLEELAARRVHVTGVPTSEATAAHARQLGFELRDPGEVSCLDVVVDGADELDHHLRLTKGGGGALLREKVVASMATSMLVIATLDKLVDRLALSFPLPVEVVPFAAGPVTRTLEEFGFEVQVRDAGRYRTDNANVVLDCVMPGGLDDPEATDAWITLIPGVVCCGLFVDLADAAILGSPDGSVTERRRDDASLD